MHFDDRLGTVLRLRADGPALKRIQFRQLLDLLGTMPAEAHGEQVDGAYTRLTELATTIPADERAALVGDQGLRLRSPRLVAALAASESPVAQRALERAELDENQWLDLIPALPMAARGHVGARRDLDPRIAAKLARLGVHSRALPPAAVAATDAAVARPQELPSQPAPDRPADGEGIGAIVRRIEAYRRAKQTVDHLPIGDSPRLPLGEEHVLHLSGVLRAFDFATDAAARIVWSDPGVAPMVTGLSLSGLAAPGLGEALKRRQPLRAVALELEGAPALAGTWQVDAAPWFDPLTGRHLGWRGRMRRPASATAGPPPLVPVQDSQADRIRQALHELRTPVNAIQGFAEIIQQQLFGTTPHEYRALAAAIAGDAARMLAAFEELERLAKLDGGAIALEEGTTNLTNVVEATVTQLAAHTRQRGSGFALKSEGEALTVPLAQIEVERIVWRLLATLAGVSAPGEVLKLRLRQRHGAVRVDAALPATLVARSEPELFQASAGAIPQVVSAGVFGVGFALRLVAAEAKAAGGVLLHKGTRLRLILPSLTASGSDHSEGSAEAG